MGPVDKQDAQLQFLHVVRGLQCDKCIQCRVWTNEEFPAQVAENTELKLVVSCSGILFFSREPCQCILAIDFSHVVSFRSYAETLFLEVQIEKEMSHIQLVCDAGDGVCRALSTHITDRMDESSFLHRNTRLPHEAAPASLLTYDTEDPSDKEEDMFQEMLTDIDDLFTKQERQGTSIERSADRKVSPFVKCCCEWRAESQCIFTGQDPGRDFLRRNSLSSMSAASCSLSTSSASAMFKR